MVSEPTRSSSGETKLVASSNAASSRVASPRRSCASDTRRSSSAFRNANTNSRTRSFSVALIASSASESSAGLSPSRPLNPARAATRASRLALSSRQESRLA